MTSNIRAENTTGADGVQERVVLPHHVERAVAVHGEERSLPGIAADARGADDATVGMLGQSAARFHAVARVLAKAFQDGEEISVRGQLEDAAKVRRAARVGGAVEEAVVVLEKRAVGIGHAAGDHAETGDYGLVAAILARLIQRSPVGKPAQLRRAVEHSIGALDHSAQRSAWRGSAAKVEAADDLVSGAVLVQAEDPAAPEAAAVAPRRHNSAAHRRPAGSP